MGLMHGPMNFSIEDLRSADLSSSLVASTPRRILMVDASRWFGAQDEISVEHHLERTTSLGATVACTVERYGGLFIGGFWTQERVLVC